MREKEKRIERYLGRIRRNLNLSRELKGRISSDLRADFYARLEQGQSPEQIMEELGSPKEAAKRLETEFSEEKSGEKTDGEKRASILLACLGAGGALSLLFQGIAIFRMKLLFGGGGPEETVSVIGGADGPTSVFIAGRLSPFFWDGGLFPLALCLGVASVFLGRKRKKGRGWLLGAWAAELFGAALFLGKAGLLALEAFLGGNFWSLDWPDLFWGLFSLGVLLYAGSRLGKRGK